MKPLVTDLGFNNYGTLTPIPTFHSHEERREWALTRRQAGVDVPVIAQEVDRSVATVYRWLSEADTSVTI
ncbi:helix-turn-helix domain-containing protein [Rhodococcus pyridinivorans]